MNEHQHRAVLRAGDPVADDALGNPCRREARVTRGALYHHFRSKQELFEAVFEEVELGVVDKVVAAVATQSDPWSQAMAGIDTYLDLCLEPRTQELALRQAPIALGWTRWREIEERHALGLIRAQVESLTAAGLIRRRSTGMLSGILFGALIEAALAIAAADDRSQARQEAGEIIRSLAEALR
ncbi:TetR/AcrR family transcriptional regulator [Actinomadura rudentiformis]|uniref:TetR/AcrR family transcriptional regulator n=1 Tax=Actinomadura rudentiformis TaxID=359158 RepID=UPI001CEFA9D6|nr:TetR/AcrR family transcriptional regulator [Actinomadura rudentiformis]